MRKNPDLKWEVDNPELGGKVPQEKKTTATRKSKTVSVADISLMEGHGEKDFSAIPQLQRIAENIPGILLEFESNPDGSYEYTYISPAFERIFGVSTNQIFKISQFLHPEDLGAMNKALKKAADTLAPFYIESRMILPERGIVWRSVNCSFSHVNEAGAKVFTGLMLDISERKRADEKLNESENRLVSLITNLQNGILVEDENRQLVLTNEMYCDMLGINALPENLKGEDCADYVEKTKALLEASISFFFHGRQPRL